MNSRVALQVISRKRSKQNIRTVVCEIREDEIIVSDSNTKDLVLKRPLEKIEFYKYVFHQEQHELTVVQI